MSDRPDIVVGTYIAGDVTGGDGMRIGGPTVGRDLVVNSRAPADSVPTDRAAAGAVLECLAPGTVHFGETFVVEAGAVGTAAAIPGTTASRLTPSGVTVQIVLSVPGSFRVLPPGKVRSVAVSTSGISAWTAFEVAAPTRPGAHEFVLNAYGNGRLLARLVTIVEVTEDRQSGPPAETTRSPCWAIPDGHAGTTLIASRGSHSFDYVLLGPGYHLGPVSRPIDVGPEGRLRELRRYVDGLAHGSPTAPSAAIAELRSWGRAMWTDLLPVGDLRDGLAGLAVTGIDLTVVADDPGSERVPWEMLHPVGGRTGFLAETVPLVRSLASRNGPAERLGCSRAGTENDRATRSILVLPDEAPQDAAEEIASIQATLRGPDDRAGAVREVPALLAALDRGDFGVLHVAAHTAKGADGAIALAAGRYLRPSDIIDYAAGNGCWADRPLVFLNACGTDRPRAGFTGWTGWAANCVAAGAGAFVGSMWDVRSDTARGFASAFYTALADDKLPLARAAHAARSATFAPGDPTWLAYAVYGHPGALLEMGI